MSFRSLLAFLCAPLPLPPVLCRGLALLYFGAGHASTTWAVEMSLGYCSYQLYYLSCLHVALTSCWLSDYLRSWSVRDAEQFIVQALSIFCICCYISSLSLCCCSRFWTCSDSVVNMASQQLQRAFIDFLKTVDLPRVRDEEYCI